MAATIKYINSFSPEESVIIKETALAFIKRSYGMLKHWNNIFTKEEKIINKGLYNFERNCNNVNKWIYKNPDMIFYVENQPGFMFFGFYIGAIEESDMRKKKKLKKEIIKKIYYSLTINPHYLEFENNLPGTR